MINGVLSNIIDYSSFDCLFSFPIIDYSLCILFTYYLVIILLITKLNSIQLNSCSIIGSLSTYYLPLFSTLFILTSNSFITIGINLIELLAGWNNYSLYYLILMSNNQLIHSILIGFILLLIYLISYY